MTEDEAKTKVCCGPRNGAHQDDDIFCKASLCMAWRWDARLPLTVAREIQKEHSGASLMEAWDIAAAQFIAEGYDDGKHGTCGLAGGSR